MVGLDINCLLYFAENIICYQIKQFFVCLCFIINMLNVRTNPIIHSLEELVPRVVPKIQAVEGATNETHGKLPHGAREKLTGRAEAETTSSNPAKSANLPHQGRQLDILAE